ncbi:hypothetical protein C8J57DRAFT_1234876 [Mycena rebaudengoi]|nr:hypothetical protein C8J57DRAFT_1234876 [Mycena rebaudengoi]
MLNTHLRAVSTLFSNYSTLVYPGYTQLHERRPSSTNVDHHGLPSIDTGRSTHVVIPCDYEGPQRSVQPADYEDALTAIAAFVHSHPSFIIQIFEHPVTIRNVSVGADYTEVLEAIRRAGYIIPAGEAMMIGIGDVDEFNATSSGGLKISRNMPILTWWSKYCTFVRIGIQWPRFSSRKIYKDERSPRLFDHMKVLAEVVFRPCGHTACNCEVCRMKKPVTGVDEASNAEDEEGNSEPEWNIKLADIERSEALAAPSFIGER